MYALVGYRHNCNPKPKEVVPNSIPKSGNSNLNKTRPRPSEGGVKFDRATYQRTYMKDYMRKYRLTKRKLGSSPT